MSQVEMKKIKKETLRKNNGKLSLYPIRFEDAVKSVLQVKNANSKSGNKND